MKLHKFAAARKKWNSSPIATLLFLLVSFAIFYGCILFVGHVAKDSLQNANLRQNPYENHVLPTPSAAPTVDALDVAAIRTPALTPAPTVTPAISVSPYPSPSYSPTPNPTATQAVVSQAVAELPSITKDAADILLFMTDESGAPDWIAAIRMRADTCCILFIPKNTVVSKSERPLAKYTVKECIKELERIWPFRYVHTVTVKAQGLPTFIDRFGGVSVNSTILDGEDTIAYLESGPSDELLRIERQQVFARAYTEKLCSVGILQLASARFEFDPYIQSDMKAGELLLLFDMLRSLDLTQMTFHTLPVDSLQQDGIRYYTPDISMTAKLAEAWVSTAE